MVLGRIIRLTDGESHSLIKARWLTKVFVAGDVLSFLAQSSGKLFPVQHISTCHIQLTSHRCEGGALLATAKDSSGVNIGNWVITGGLILQIIFFGFFVFVAGIFNYRLALRPTSRSSSLSVPWQRYLFVLYGASGLIMIRSTFRVVEYVGGQDGVLLSTEIYLYIFDATLMFLTMISFNIWHPSSIITKTALADLERGGSRSSGYAMASQSQYVRGDMAK